MTYDTDTARGFYASLWRYKRIHCQRIVCIRCLWKCIQRWSISYIREDFQKKKKDFRGIVPKGEGGVSDLWSIAPNPILFGFLWKFFFFFWVLKDMKHFVWYQYLSLMATTITPLSEIFNIREDFTCCIYTLIYTLLYTSLVFCLPSPIPYTIYRVSLSGGDGGDTVELINIGWTELAWFGLKLD